MKKDFNVNPDWYWTIRAWMIQDLHLSGLSLNVYAILHDTTKKDTWKQFEKSFLAKLTGSSKEGIRKSLKSLQSKGLIKVRSTFSTFGERLEIQVTYRHESCNASKTPQKQDSDHQQSWYPTTNKVGTHLKKEPINKKEGYAFSEEEETTLQLLKDLSINKNNLHKADDAFSSLLHAGYTPNEILNAWKIHLNNLNAKGTEKRYFTALWKFLGNDTNQTYSAIKIINSIRADQKRENRRKEIDLQRKRNEQAEEAISDLLMQNIEYRELVQKRQLLFKKALFSKKANSEFNDVCSQINCLRAKLICQLNC